MKEEIARLKAEVKRLKKFNDEALAHIAKEERKSRDRLDMVQAEVERLRKAGDELSWAFAFAVSRDDGKESGLIKAWRAAKEGNQL